ncbi:hypothetical protein OG883_38875 [Streptomyces sp. NBC_01142]|uniref:hypothetical protein n=1 Tax=Streptomyces sp. NBC_01142 TaxID=2975865 RepID=UPI00225433E9|nr:hypothetical protein [Streptomyces sp. NBC_01142]MCX4825706.1 hypothetical protein [Streptomyces sp. NBC_01142]
MFKSKKARVAAWIGGAVGIAATALGGVAWAVAGSVTAPYAQASALVNADGSLDRSKGIKAVTRAPAAGRFCVQLEDSRLNVAELTPVATLTTGGYPGQIYIEPGLNPQCGNRPDTILVVTTNWQNGGDYKPFFLLVP